MAVTRALFRGLLVGGLLGVLCTAGFSAHAQSKNRAPGFTRLDHGASVLVMSPDVELYSISAGGAVEPKADWTATAQQHLQGALQRSMSALRLTPRFLSEQDSDEFADIGSLHAAVAQSIALHHMMGGSFKLPTKNDQLDWSLGEAVAPIRDKLAADYALFVWLRDSYASSERKAAMVALALLGVGIGGGVQTGYASLVDLRTGQVMWFNRLFRASGDLRESEPAAETLKSLLTDFPASAGK